jgi:hypothetical protein
MCDIIYSSNGTIYQKEHFLVRASVYMIIFLFILSHQSLLKTRRIDDITQWKLKPNVRSLIQLEISITV